MTPTSPRWPRAPLPTVLIHWGLVLALGASLLTGLRIAADAPGSRVSRALGPWLPQGDVLVWHLMAGVLVLGLTLAYLIFQMRSGLGRRLLPERARDPSVPADRATRWRRINRRLHWLVLLLLGVSILTGLGQYLALDLLHRAALESIHLASAWGLLLYAVLHVAAQIAAGGPRRLIGMLVPRASLVSVGALAAGAAAVAALGLVLADRATLSTLEVGRTAVAPTLDGSPEDDVWQGARPVRVRLGGGANLPGGESEATLRALHDGERLYLLCEWTDPTRSQKHVPLVKGPEGWGILQTAYRQADETRFYEDKLALMLAPANPLAALASIHLGPRPLAGQPGAPGGRGLHYTTDGSVLDVWHWKSVRNGALHQADDNFFGPPLPAPAETPRERDPSSGAWIPRYMAGYRSDPPGTYPGYEMNWEFFDEVRSLPLRLPRDPRDVAGLAGADLDPDSPDQGQWWIEMNDTRPYASMKDDLPLGTVLPSVLSTSRLTGDRGDIAARGRWADGRWHLELSRPLDTGSPRDVPLVDGTLLWVAVFDHSQTRHAYHLRPLRLSLSGETAPGGGQGALAQTAKGGPGVQSGD